MASFKILGKNGTNNSLYQDTDVAILPNSVTSSTAISFNSGAIIPAGKTLSTQSTGGINLPNNVSSKFNIEGVSVSANVTATNVNTLTGGGNADALHIHTSGQAASLDLSGQTLWSSPAIGEVGYISANNTLAKTNATSITTSGAIGAYAGISGTVLMGGRFPLLFDAGLTLSANDKVFLSDVTEGRVTNIVPTTATHVEYEIGKLLDTTGYNSGTGSAQSCVWQPKIPIIV